jgi:hypothetical protein
MKKSPAIAVVFFLLVSGFSAVKYSAADSQTISPLTGAIGYSTYSGDQRGASFSSAPAKAMPSLIAGGLYGTDGQNLYIIDKTTGSATLIGPHGPVESFIGALAFDSNGVLYGISASEDAKLYRIDPTSGAATAVGALGIGFVFEGGLDFASGQLFGVDQGSAVNAKTFTINTATGAATVLGPTPGDHRDINGLAFDGQAFYAIDRVSNSLGTVNPSTGSYTPIGNPEAAIGATGGLAIDPTDGTLYATFKETGGFYILDKSTGAAILIAFNDVDYGLAFAPGTVTRVYLPLIVHTHSPSVTFPLYIGDTIPARPAAYQGEVFYTTSVQIPDELPSSGRFYLSSQRDAVAEVLVDDELTIVLDEAEVFAYNFSTSGYPMSATVEVPRPTMEQLAGRTVTVEYQDIYAYFVEASAMWLIWIP